MAATSPRPATGRGELNPVDGLAQLSFLVHGLLDRLATERDLSMIQTRLLGVLRDRQPTMNELARLLELDKSSITGLVDRAQRRGLVERTPSKTDGRVVLVRLTRTGRSLVRQVTAQFEADVNALLAPLSAAERSGFSALVSRLVTARAAGRGIDLFVTATAVQP
jgi:MarR family transcriptional regulator, lower aerobic nicotinate degradation pathway regulator